MLSYCTEFFSTSGAELATGLDAWFGVVGNSWMCRGRQAFALNVKDQRRVAASTIRSAARSVANASSWLAHGDAANAPTVVASLASLLDALAEAARDLDGPDPGRISTTIDEMDVLPGQGLSFVAFCQEALVASGSSVVSRLCIANSKWPQVQARNQDLFIHFGCLNVFAPRFAYPLPWLLGCGLVDLVCVVVCVVACLCCRVVYVVAIGGLSTLT